MPDDRPQHIGNHARWLPIFHFFALPVTMLYALNQIYTAVRSPTTASIVWAIYTTAIACAAGLPLPRPVLREDPPPELAITTTTTIVASAIKAASRRWR